MFAWWPWKEATEPEYSHVSSTLNTTTTPESGSQSVNDGAAPQTGLTPRLSAFEGRPERVLPPGFPPTSERNEIPLSSPPIETVREIPLPVNSSDTPALILPSPAPTPRQQLEFLEYLIRRGIVNEGFEEGQVPEQYRRK
jgi:hypothetical protein